MGFFSSVSKAVSSAVSAPAKVISSAAQGVTNLQKDLVIKPVVDLASTAVSGVGQVMSQPGAGAVLGAAGAAFGVPGLGSLANGFAGIGGPMSPSPAPVAPPAPVVISAPASGSNNNTILIAAGIGGLMLILVMFLTTTRGKR
jgi:hypothetical protein